MPNWGVPGLFHRTTGKGNAELEQAKTVLRRAGRIVFNADVTDGSRGKGLVRVDGETYKPMDVIVMARKVGK